MLSLQASGVCFTLQQFYLKKCYLVSFFLHMVHVLRTQHAGLSAACPQDIK